MRWLIALFTGLYLGVQVEYIKEELAFLRAWSIVKKVRVDYLEKQVCEELANLRGKKR